VILLRFILVATSLLVGGCATLACGVLKTGREPALELAYCSAGDGPTVDILRVYSGSYRKHIVLEFEPLGLRSKCRRLSESESRELRSVITDSSFLGALRDEFARGNHHGVHRAVLGIETSEGQVQRRPEVLSPRLIDPLSRVEEAFRREFPDAALPFSIRDYEPSQ